VKTKGPYESSIKMSDHDLHDPRLDAAYRDVSGEQPPVELDERIRAAARRAVSARPQSLEARGATAARRSWSARWRVPLSIAATIVLVVTVTLLVQDEEKRKLLEETPAAASTPEPQAAIPVQPGAPPPAAQPSESTSAPARRQAKRVQPVPDASAPAVEEAAPSPERMVRDPFSPTPERRREERVPAASALAADRAAPARERDALQVVPGAASGSDFSRPLSSDRTNAERPDREQRNASGGRSAPRGAEESIGEIRRLKHQGRDAEAIAELAEFQRRFPDYVLPRDLVQSFSQ
jgi:hypothetical protein